VILSLLYYKKTTREGVIAGMLSGFLVSVVWVVGLKDLTYDLYEAIPGFLIGGLVTLVVSHLTYSDDSGESQP
jgi:sodium/proline symporter